MPSNSPRPTANPMDKLRQCIADKNALPDLPQLQWLEQHIRRGGETAQMESWYRTLTERVQQFAADKSKPTRWKQAQGILRALANRSNVADCMPDGYKPSRAERGAAAAARKRRLQRAR